MEAAVHIDIVAGGVAQAGAAQQADGPGHILRRAPAGDGEGALFDQGIVLALHRAGHIGGDNAGAHLVDKDALSSQTVGVERRQHRDTRLGDTVFTAVGGGHHRAAAGHIDDDTLAAIDRFLRNHLLGHQLRQEHIALGVDADNIVKAFLAHIQQIGADFGSNTCIINQHIHAAKGGQCAVQNLLAVVGAADVGLHVGAVDALCFQLVQRCLVFLLCAGGDHDDIVSIQPQLLGNGKANAAAGPGDDGSFFHKYTLSISRGSSRAAFS